MTQILILIVLMITSFTAVSQSKARIAAISIDGKGLNVDNEVLTGIINLELEKTNRFEVLDKYDVADAMKKNSISPYECYGKSCLVRAGKLLKTDKMLTGSVEKIGNKIIVILRMVDVAGDAIEKSDVVEYIDQQNELQVMLRISLNNLLGIENDQKLVDLLVNFQQPISSSKTTVNLSGPRMGAAYTMGEYGKRMSAPSNQGGFNMYPVSSMFGYQLETQYLSAGDFQALVEFVGTINGMESGTFSPSLLIMNGFRFNKSGFEFGLGPIFRVSKIAKGYYNSDGKWVLTKYNHAESLGYDVRENLDRRGSYRIGSGLIFAVGKTFRSGYLNVPVNAYVSPRKDGTVVGLTFGFNISKGHKRR